jgi:hypothetical protein
MSRAFLDLTDASLTLSVGKQVVRSPGIVLSQADDFLFGDAAFAQLKRRPLDVRTDMLSQLATTPLGNTFGNARHTADLVYEHLKGLFESSDSANNLCLITPGNLEQAQLELLLGILGSLNVNPSAVIDRALLAHPAELGSGLNLNLQWRQLVVSEVTVNANLCQVEKITVVPGLGYLDLLELCLEECADACVDQTRFDPRRSAESEQTLLDALPGVLAALRDRPEVSVELGTTSFKVSRSRLERAGQKIASAINAKAGALSIDESLSVFPGITFDAVASIDSLTAAAEDLLLDHSNDQPLTRISNRRTASAVTPADKSVDTSASGDVTIAPAASDEIDKTMVTASAVQGAQPTHVLIDAVAHRIADTDEQGLGFGVIKRDGVPCIDETLRNRINVLSVSGSHDRLTVGSRLYRNDGKEAMLIIVES